MLKIDILFNLFIKDCMFITSTTKNSKGCSITKLIVFGHTHGLEEAWLLVLASCLLFLLFSQEMLHYFLEVLLSSRKTKLRKTHFKIFFLYWTLNEAIIPWSEGCTTLVTLGAKKKNNNNIAKKKIRLKNQMIHPYQHTFKGMSSTIVHKSTFCFWNMKCVLRLIIQLSNAFGVI